MPAFGIGTAVTALTGRYIGRRRPDLALQRAHLGFKVSMAYMLPCGLLFILFRRPMMLLFTDDPQTIELIRSLRPDVMFVFGWSQLLGRELLAIAPCIGSHPALLPRDRGRHPITWALVDGLDETGLTFLWLDEGADSGDILWQRAFRVCPDDDAADVYAKIEDLAEAAVREFVPQLINKTAPRRPQDERLATYRRKRTDEERVIDWRRPRQEIHNLVRGLAKPYIGAVARVGGQDVLVWKTRILGEDPGNVPVGGVVSAGNGSIAVRAGDGLLEVVESSPDGLIEPGVTLEVAG